MNHFLILIACFLRLEKDRGLNKNSIVRTAETQNKQKKSIDKFYNSEQLTFMRNSSLTFD